MYTLSSLNGGRQRELNNEFKGNKDYIEHPSFAMIYAIIKFESVATAVKTARCH